MAMMLFTGLNGLGVVFLLYVLVQFWKEGHRSKNGGARQYAIEFSEENRPEVVVVTHRISGGLQVEPAPVSHNGQAGLSVVPMGARESSVQGRQLHRASGGLQVADAPLARQSSAASGKPALWRRRVEPAPDSADRTDETAMKRFSTR
jgi:hypothetical protein